MNRQEVVEFATKNHDRYLSELKQYLSIPSVSTLPENKKDIEAAAEWLKSQLEGLGMEHTVIEQTMGHPIVRSEWLKMTSVGTVLAYGHYDVQPADPIDQWVTEPFAPTVRGENIYARGAADMKGQGHAFLKALEAWMKKKGGLPVNLKVVFEGEEEIGSPHLESYIEKNKEELKCDLCLNCDAHIATPTQPSLTYGLRGLLYYDISIRGPKSDLHSGTFGGIVYNPAVLLAELVAGLHDRDGRIMLPGFYDGVRTLPDEERKDINKDGFSDEEWKKMAGIEGFRGEKGFSQAERIGARPTLDVNGLISGFTGKGQKTVIPAVAAAKVSIRTVPYQNPERIDAALREYFNENVPASAHCEITRLSSSPYAIVERSSHELGAATQALTESYGVRPIFKLEGGTDPIVAITKTKLGVNSVILGCGLSDSGIHAPNERLHLPTYYKGIETYVRFLELLNETEPK